MEQRYGINRSYPVEMEQRDGINKHDLAPINYTTVDLAPWECESTPPPPLTSNSNSEEDDDDRHQYSVYNPEYDDDGSWMDRPRETNEGHSEGPVSSFDGSIDRLYVDATHT